MSIKIIIFYFFQCLVIEDALAGVQAAQAAKMRQIFYLVQFTFLGITIVLKSFQTSKKLPLMNVSTC